MKVGQIERLIRRYLLPEFAGFEARGLLLYEVPLDCVLRGFAFDRSGLTRDEVAVWCFAQPLYVPDAHLSFNYGQRVRDAANSEWWRIPEDPAEVMRELAAAMWRRGMGFIRSHRTPHDLSKLKSSPDDPNDAEVIAYSALLAGDTTAGTRLLRRLKSLGDSNDAKVRPWIIDIATRSQRVLDALERGDQTVKNLLQQWCEQTAQELKLVDRPRHGAARVLNRSSRADR